MKNSVKNSNYSPATGSLYSALSGESAGLQRQKSITAFIFAAQAVIILSIIVACSNNNFPSQPIEHIESKLNITDLEEHSGSYITALGFGANREKLFAAEGIGTDSVFFCEEITENTVQLSIWYEQEIDKKSVTIYSGLGPFHFTAYILNKPTFTRSEELTVRNYLYNGEPKPWWLEAVGEVNGVSYNGKFEGNFKELLPFSK